MPILGLSGDDYELELTYNYDHGPYVVGDGFAHIAPHTRSQALHQEHSAKGYELQNQRGFQVIHQAITLLKIHSGYKVEVIRENKKDIVLIFQKNKNNSGNFFAGLFLSIEPCHKSCKRGCGCPKICRVFHLQEIHHLL